MSRRPSLRFGAVLAAITVGVAAVPLALVTSFTPASASSTNVVIVISKPRDAQRQLESAFAAHHFNVTVTEKVAPSRLVGSILSVSTERASRPSGREIGELHGSCAGGASNCVDGLVLPRHFSGTARVTIGRGATVEGVRRR